jgi:short-subunit dehydrogenase
LTAIQSSRLLRIQARIGRGIVRCAMRKDQAPSMLPTLERLLPLGWRQPLEGRHYDSGPFAGLAPVTIVTGGSEGIGLALASRFAAAGHDRLLIARGEGGLAQAATKILAQHRVTVTTLALDITSTDAPQMIDRKLSEMGGYAHILVNNAGIGLSGPFLDHTRGDLTAMMDLNMRALTRLMHHVLPGMRSRGRGGILNVASLGAYAPGPWQAAYYASKAYLLSLSEAVAYEVEPDGVRITVVAPGPVETGFHRRMLAESAFYRRLLPPLWPETVASWAYWGFKLGLRVIVPGVINMVLALVLRILPHRIVMPVVGWLLRRREKDV